MKKLMAFILVIGFPILMTAQKKSVSVQKDQIPRQTTRTKVIQRVPQGNQDQNEIPFFVVNSVEPLRVETSHLASLLTPQPSQAQNWISPIPNEGNLKYKTGNGVVLDALNPFDPVTGSLIMLRNVYYTKEIVSDIKNNAVPTLEQAFNNYSASETPIYAIFRDISTTPHTYLLTIGMRSSPGVNVTIRSEYFGSSRLYDNSALIYNEATSETRILFIEHSYHDPSNIVTSGSFDISYSHI